MRLVYPKGCKKSAAYLASNGCGADGSLFDLVPDNFVGLDISEACKIHDYCYTVGTTEADKVKADLMFYKNLKTIVLNNDNLILKTTRLWLAKQYYKAVRDFGNEAFWNGK